MGGEELSLGPPLLLRWGVAVATAAPVALASAEGRVRGKEETVMTMRVACPAMKIWKALS